jgi:hypothetical protein
LMAFISESEIGCEDEYGLRIGLDGKYLLWHEFSGLQ